MNNQQITRKKPDYLTEREFTCLELFIQYGDKTRAGKEAGYSAKTAAAQACRLVNSRKGKKYLDSRMVDLDNEKIADANEAMEYLTRVMRGQEKDQFDMEVSIADRTKAAQELLKRYDRSTEIGADNVQIIVDIPRPQPEAEQEEINENNN